MVNTKIEIKTKLYGAVKGVAFNSHCKTGKGFRKNVAFGQSLNNRILAGVCVCGGKEQATMGIGRAF